MKNKNSVGFDGNLTVPLSKAQMLNAAEWTWKRPRQFPIIMKPHSVTENYCEYSVKTIINKQSQYLPENMHGVRCHYYTLHTLTH